LAVRLAVYGLGDALGVLDRVMLAGAGHPAKRLDVSARVEMDKIDGHFAIVGILLDLEAEVPGMAETDVIALAEKAKAGCPVSQALKAVPIRLQARVA
jgi:lipoyl-dependent peroxiredoxin